MRNARVSLFCLLAALIASQPAGAIMIFDDRGVHNITTAIDDDVAVNNGTTFNLLPGGSVLGVTNSGPTSDPGVTINLPGGKALGDVSLNNVQATTANEFFNIRIKRSPANRAASKKWREQKAELQCPAILGNLLMCVDHSAIADNKR